MKARAFLALLFLFEVLLESGFQIKTNIIQGFSLKNGLLYGLLLLSIRPVISMVSTSRGPLRLSVRAYVALCVWTLATCFMLSPVRGGAQYGTFAALIAAKSLVIDSCIAFLVFAAGLPRTTDILGLTRWIVLILSALSVLTLVEVRFPGLDIYGFATSENRPRGPLGEPNQTAAIIAMCLPIAIGWAVRLKSYSRIIFGACAVVLSANIVVTGSRGGVVAAGLGCLFLLFAIRREVRVSSRVLLLMAIPIVIAGGWALLPQASQSTVVERLLALGDVRTNAREVSAGRTLLWQWAYELWIQRPFLGHGWGYFRQTTGNATHNDYILYLVDTGVVGLACYALFWTGIVRLLHLTRRSGRGDPLMVAAFQASVIALMTAVFFVNLYMPWIFATSVAGAIIAYCVSLMVPVRRANDQMIPGATDFRATVRSYAPPRPNG